VIAQRGAAPNAQQGEYKIRPYELRTLIPIEGFETLI